MPVLLFGNVLNRKKVSKIKKSKFLIVLIISFCFVLLDRVSVSIQNVIAINPKLYENNVQQNDTLNVTQSTSAEPERTQFQIIYAERNLNSSNQNKWRYKSITFISSDAHVVQFWINILQKALSGKCISL